ncbi:MAG: hypothetical protein Fur0035_11440 [Anaerolineales bacterium]
MVAVSVGAGVGVSLGCGVSVALVALVGDRLAVGGGAAGALQALNSKISSRRRRFFIKFCYGWVEMVRV